MRKSRNSIIWSVLFILHMIAYAQICSAQTFTDVAVSQGLDINVDGSTFGIGASFYDFDHDGWDDLSIGQVSSDPLFFRNNQGVFEPIDLGIPNNGEIKHLLWVDFDNDGDSDLFISKYIGVSRLYQNDGDLSFTDITESAGFPMDDDHKGWGCAWGDFNGDGWLDVYWANYEYSAAPEALKNQLFKNNGDGTFEDVSIISGTDNGSVLSFQPLWIDYDLDGDQDIHLINDRNAFDNAMYENDGEGSFVDVGAAIGMGHSFDAMSNTAVDFDRDGDLDFYITNGIYGNYMYENNGDGSYDNIVEDLGLEVFRVCWTGNWIDFENDGWEDVYITTAYISQDTSQNFAFSNIEGVFTPNISGGFSDDKSSGYSIVSGDINNDGFADMFLPAETSTYPSRLWLNDATSDNHFLKVSLEGVISNRDGIGSWIKVFIGDTVLVRYTFCGEDYLCQDSQREIIGLGSNELIDSLEITWLSGFRDVFYTVPADQTLHIVEGSSLAPTSETFYLPLCPGDSLFLDAGDAASFLWNSGDTTQILVVDTAGTYSVSLFNNFGLLLAIDSMVVSSVIPVQLTADVFPITCFGETNGEIEIGSVIPTTFIDFFWNTGDTSLTLINLGPGIYSVTVTDFFGCVYSISLELIEPDLLAGQLEINNNGGVDGSAEIIPEGGTPPLLFEWSDGFNTISSSSTVSGLGSGSYFITISDAHGCEFTLDFIILSTNNLSNFAANVFPNPSREDVFLDNIGPDILQVIIYDSKGQLLDQFRPVYQSFIVLHMSLLPSGIYFVQLRSSNTVQSIKIIRE